MHKKQTLSQKAWNKVFEILGHLQYYTILLYLIKGIADCIIHFYAQITNAVC